MRRVRRVWGAVLALAMLASVLPGALAGGIARADSAADSLAGSGSAALVIAERTVFVFRDSFGTMPPVERRDRAGAVLARVIQRMHPDSVHVVSDPYGNRLSYGARPLFTVTPGDVDTLAGQTLDGVTHDATIAVGTALGEAMRERSPRYLIIAGLLALLATLALIGALRLLVWSGARVTRWLVDYSEKRLGKVAAKGIVVPSHDRMTQSVRTLVHTVEWVLSLLFTYLWLTFTLRRFPWTAPFGDALRGVMWGSVRTVLVSVIHALPGLATVVVIVFLTRLASRAIGLVFSGIERGTLSVPWIHPDTAVPTRRIATTILWLFAFMASWPYIPGSDTAVFKGASVLIGALISFGSSGVVSQAMSGFVLMYSRAYKKGEFIHVGEIMGTVSELGMLSTKITTPRNEEVTIPNSLMVGSTTTNDSRLAAELGLYLNTTVTIGYDAPWRQVHAMLIEAAKRTSGLRKTPEPFVMQRALSDFYVEYVLAAQIEEPARRVMVLAELHQNIQDQFNEYGVQIMSPHYENDRMLGVPVVDKSRWYAAPARPPEGAGPS